MHVTDVWVYFVDRNKIRIIIYGYWIFLYILGKNGLESGIVYDWVVFMNLAQVDEWSYDFD